MVLVRETMTADWQAWRDIRLQALRDAPAGVIAHPRKQRLVYSSSLITPVTPLYRTQKVS